MTLVDIPLWLQDGVYPARLDRQLVGEVWREGILRGLAVTAGTGFTVNVSAGAAIIQGDDQPSQGKYLAVVASNMTGITFDPAPGVGSRIDRVVVRVIDPNAGGVGTAAGQIAVIRGTAGTPGTLPALPPTAVELAQVTLNAGDLGIVALRIATAFRPVGAINGAVSAQTAASLSATTPVKGDVRYVTEPVLPSGASGTYTAGTNRPATPGLYVYDGTHWNPPWNVAWGIMCWVVVTETTAAIGPGGYDTPTTCGFTAVANRLLKITLKVNLYSPAGGGAFIAPKVDTLGLMRVDQANTFGVGAILNGSALWTSTAGAHTFKMSIVGIGGTVNMQGSADPGYIIVEDIGPANQPV